jgi:Family of unknown function (DUF6502)
MAALEPLAGLFVELGISSPEAESLLRSLLVHSVHRRELERSAKRVNLSKIALLTGIHRNEVKRILASPPGIDPGREAQRHRANRVLSGWHDDPDYQNEKGSPLVLPIEDSRRGQLSFRTLAEHYAPGVYPGLILDELIRVGVVEAVGEQQVKVRARTYREKDVKVQELEELGQRARDLLETLVHNLNHPASSRPCETAIALDVDEQWVAVLRNAWRKPINTLISAANEDINSRRVRVGKGDKKVRVGITAFFFEGPTSEGVTDDTAKKKRTRRHK